MQTDDLSATELEEDLQALTVNDLKAFMQTSPTKYTRESKSSKALRIRAIIDHNPPEALASLLQQGREVRLSKLAQKAQSRKRRAEYDAERRTRPRLGTEDVAAGDAYDTAHFLDLPTQQQRLACYREFYEATGNDAVQMATCGVCARWLLRRKSHIMAVPILTLPHPERLVPKADTAHPAQTLTNGMLLETSAIVTDDAGQPSLIDVCGECWDALRKENTNSPPKFSLANNLWVGNIPWELRRLTIPEQLLIAHLYPRVFVFKMWPKKADGIGEENMQRGMRGTVSTFEQDIRGITAMTEGKLMPRPAAILASIITVTFIAKGRLPKSWLYNTFRVRRHAVHSALLWLRHNNPKYYGDIEISEERLEQLPEDGVPEEIIANVHQSEDVGIIDEESQGYVPREEEGPDHGEYTGSKFHLRVGAQIRRRRTTPNRARWIHSRR